MTTPGGGGASPATFPVQRVLTVNPLPGATANTYGVAVAVTLPARVNGLLINGFKQIGNGVAGENLQCQIVYTFSDNSTVTQTTTAFAGNTTSFAALSQIIGAQKDGLYVTGVTVQVQSTIAASTATPAVSIYGVQAA